MASADPVQSKLIAPLTTINTKFDDYYKAYIAFEKCIETNGATVAGMTAPTSGTVYKGKTSTGTDTGTDIFSYDSSTKAYSSSSCNTEASALNTKYTALNGELATTTSALGAGPNIASMKDDKTYTQFVNHYQDMQKTRSGLDVKLAQLYQIQNSLPSMSDRSVDSVILASILWIVLASALVYYIFIGNLFNFSQSVPVEDTATTNLSGGFASFLPSWFTKTPATP